ncbi:MBL-fold metallo-hydrolase superfamily [hydrothermal vent metagenome]|uniref:MBL-fold metallo-hydrolase superfamily n=1 Tax=hydrothermal vent metagenome TaxID=652676 RepID=A0A3B1AC79_9ZZZZ
MNSNIDNNNSFELDVLELGPMENFVYLLSDKATKRAAIVDPAWDVPQMIHLAKSKGLIITDILLTHSHHDHINGIDEVLNLYDAQLHLLKPEAEFWGSSIAKPSLHHGGDFIQLGKTEITILHTPGHTPGSACYQVAKQLITGDTMFVYGCGRCDLAGGDPEIMYNTLQNMANDLPDETIICPGHNYGESSTCSMAEQKHGNPFLHFDDKQAFSEYRMVSHDKTRDAPYHPILKK